MSKNQLILTSFLTVIPAVGLIAALVLGATGGVAETAGMWGLFGATLLLSIGALASPVVAFLLIPGAADAEDAAVGTEAGEQESVAGEETDKFANANELAEDGDFEVQDDDNGTEMEVASSGDMDDFDDDDDFQSGDDFDDDEDFV